MDVLPNGVFPVRRGLGVRVLDLFSGIGGFSLGLERAGMETVAFCEIEAYPRKVLAKHWPDVPIYDDVRTLTKERLDKDGIGSVDVICGGFPCQDISIAGKNAGIEGEKSGLWKEFRRVIDETRPKYTIIENVSALLGRGLNVLLSDLSKIGYDATWTTYDTKYFGKPQRRRRVYIVAFRDGIPANCDLFETRQRDSTLCEQQMENIDKSFRWDYSEGRGDKHTFTFFTRQRSNEFKETGLSGTLAKRDYKSFTDLVFQDSVLRRVTPEERMNLQGLPTQWMSGCGLTSQEEFLCNGMSVPVVRYIGGLLIKYDVELNAPDGASFFADGRYRYLCDWGLGSYIISGGTEYGSIFSIPWLETRSDYYRLGTCNN